MTSGQRLHHARGVGNKVVLCTSAILCVLFLCYNTSYSESTRTALECVLLCDLSGKKTDKFSKRVDKI